MTASRSRKEAESIFGDRNTPEKERTGVKSAP
jgi:hypothetical protein